MSRTAVHQIMSALAVALLLVACVPQEPESERKSLDELVAEVEAANAAAAAEADGHDHGGHDHGEDADGVGEEPSDDTTEPADAATAEATPVPSTGEPTPEPTIQSSGEPEGPVMEQHDDFDITVTLSATCVQQGGEMSIEVDTGEKNTGVVYLAYYAGGESGAPPPWGEGHGGNNGDLTDDDGRYDDTWVVSPTAPVGPARVEVMANRNTGEAQKSTAVVRFDVAEAGSGGCDR